MALNFHNEEYNKPKVVTPEITTPGTSSVSPAPEPTKAPIPIAEKKEDDNKGIGISKGTDSSTTVEQTVDDKYQDLKEKLLKGEIKEEDLTQEEKELIASYDKQTENYKKTIKTDISPEKAKRLEEYNKIMQSDKSAYAKTSDVIDKYLLQNDKEYKNLPDYNLKDGDKGYDYNKDLRRKYRDGIIHDLQEKINPNLTRKKLDLKRRQAGFNQIAKIFILCDKNDRTIQSFAELPREEILKKIADSEFSLISKIFEKADINNKNLTSYEKLNNITEVLLSKNEKYQQLKTKEEKEKFRQDYLCNFLGKTFDIKVSAEFLKDPKNEPLLNATIELQKVLEEKQIGIDQFRLLTTDKQAKYVLIALSHVQKNLPKEQQEFIEINKTKFQALADLQNPNAKERDILNFLKKIPESERTKAQQELIKSYGLLDEKILNEKAEISSIATIAALSNTDAKKVAVARLESHLENKKSLDELANDKYFRQFKHDVEITADTNIDSAVFKHIAKKFGISEAEVIKFFSKDGIYTGKRSMAHAFGKGEANQIVNAKFNASHIDNKETKKALEGIIEKGSRILDKKTINKIETHPLNEQIAKNNPNFINAAWKGYNENKNLSNSDKTEIQDNIQKANFSDDYKQFTVNAMVSNGTAEQQKYYIDHYKNTTDKNVIKGLAAAEPNIHDSVKNEYSQKLDRIIENNGLQNDREIQIARETGQTSFERTQSSEGAKSEASNPNNKTTSPISSSTPEAGVRPTKVTISTIYISQESKTYAREIKTTLAQLDSENKKAEAMKKAADNIAKIQKDAIEREYTKAEQQKIQEQKQAVETAKKENAKKSEEKLKSDLANAVDTSIEEIKEELPTSPEAAEVQKAFGEMFNELKAYAKAGQIDQVYSLLGKIPKAQEKFLEKLATKHISTITHFIKTADKAVIRQLCELNPSLIAVLDKSTLLEIGISKAKIIKYGDKDQIAGLLTDLQMSSTKDTLNEFYEIMGIKEDNPQDPAEAVKKNGNVNGGDDHMARLMQNMKDASKNNEIALSSNIVGGSSYRFPEGTKKKLDPKEFWG